MNDESIGAVFNRALDVVNRSLDHNQYSIPYKELIDTCETMLGDDPMGVEIYEEGSDEPAARFAIRFVNRRFAREPDPEIEAETAWRVSYRFLKQVAGNPDDYIPHPEKLEWDWVLHKLGLRDG